MNDIVNDLITIANPNAAMGAGAVGNAVITVSTRYAVEIRNLSISITATAPAGAIFVYAYDPATGNASLLIGQAGLTCPVEMMVAEAKLTLIKRGHAILVTTTAVISAGGLAIARLNGLIIPD